MNLNVVIGANIKWYRYQQKISQDVLANAINKDTGNISLFENGKHNLTIKNIDAIANQLNIKTIELFNENNLSKVKTLPTRINSYIPKEKFIAINYNNNSLKLIAMNIKWYRYQNGITQEQLSKKLEWKMSYLSTIETGDANITINNLQYILTTLKISIFDLLNEKTATKANYLPKRVDEYCKNKKKYNEMIKKKEQIK